VFITIVRLILYVKLFVTHFDFHLSAVQEVNIIMPISKIRYKTYCLHVQ